MRDIKDNIESCGFGDVAHATRQKVLPFLNNLTEKYDIVFADPPYNFYKERTDRAESLLGQVERVIPEGGAIVLKHPSSLEVPKFATLTLADQRKFGTNTVSLWVKVPDKKKSRRVGKS